MRRAASPTLRVMPLDAPPCRADSCDRGEHDCADARCRRPNTQPALPTSTPLETRESDTARRIDTHAPQQCWLEHEEQPPPVAPADDDMSWRQLGMGLLGLAALVVLLAALAVGAEWFYLTHLQTGGAL